MMPASDDKQQSATDVAAPTSPAKDDPATASPASDTASPASSAPSSGGKGRRRKGDAADPSQPDDASDASPAADPAAPAAAAPSAASTVAAQASAPASAPAPAAPAAAAPAENIAPLSSRGRAQGFLDGLIYARAVLRASAALDVAAQEIGLLADDTRDMLSDLERAERSVSDRLRSAGVA